MANKESEKKLAAFNSIVALIEDFDSDSQRHVLAQVASWLDVGSPGSSSGVAIATGTAQAERPRRALAFSLPDSTSPKEFLLEKAPQTNVERIACLAYYLTHHREMPHFKTLEISKLNTEAAQPKFSNASYTARDATTAGLLVSGSKGTKQISAMGEQFVLALPDRESAKSVLERMKPRRRRKTAPKKRKKQ